MSEKMTMTADEVNRKLELLLFGDDLTAKTEQEKIIASGGFWTTEFARQYRTAWEDAKSGMYFGEWIWETREGKPYQSAIEQHVRDYRRAPRDFTTPDGMMLVLKAMLEKRFHAIMHYTDKPSAHFSTGTPLPVTWHYEATLPLTVAVCAVAALAALEAQDA
jgi:hypothetical protein